MIHKVLVPLDGSGRAEAALPHAVTVARAFGAELHLLRVIESPGRNRVSVVDSLGWRHARLEAGRYLEGILREVHQAGQEAHTEVVEGRAADQIVRFIASNAIDLVVLATHGAGAATEFELGGTVRKAMERAAASILLVPNRIASERGRLPCRYRRILVPVDCSRRSEWSVSLATVLARAQQAEVVLAHVVLIPEVSASGAPSERQAAGTLVAANRAAAGAYLERLVARLEGLNLRVRQRVSVARSVSEALAEVVREEEPDVTVLCAHGATADVQRPYGSVATQLLRPGLGVVAVLQDLPRASAQTPPPPRSAAIPAAL